MLKTVKITMNNRHIMLHSYLIFLFILTGCVDSPAIENLNLFSVTNTYSLPLPINASPRFLASQYFEENNTLYCLNYQSQEILLYDISGRQLRGTMPLAHEGPGNVGTVYGFSVVATDSILLSSGPYASSFIVNSKGLKVGKLDYEWKDDQTPIYTRFSSIYNNMHVVANGESIFVPQGVPYRGIGQRPINVNHQPIARYDNRLGVMELLPFKYPSNYWNKKLMDQFVFTGVDSFLLFALVEDEAVYKVNTYSQNTTEHKMRSRYFYDNILPADFSLGPEAVQQHLASTPRFIGLVIDPYRKLIYRVVSIPPKDNELSQKKIEQLSQIPDEFSIVVSDYEFNKIFEQVFEDRKYIPGGMFVTKEGLNIPRSHPDYFDKANNESELVYDVFSIEEH